MCVYRLIQSLEQPNVLPTTGVHRAGDRAHVRALATQRHLPHLSLRLRAAAEPALPPADRRQPHPPHDPEPASPLLALLAELLLPGACVRRENHVHVKGHCHHPPLKAFTAPTHSLELQTTDAGDQVRLPIPLLLHLRKPLLLGGAVPLLAHRLQGRVRCAALPPPRLLHRPAHRGRLLHRGAC